MIFQNKKKNKFILLFDKVSINFFGIQRISRFIYITMFCCCHEMLVYMGESIQEWTRKNLWKTAFKNFEGVWPALDRSFGSFFNTLPHMYKNIFV